MAAPSSGSNFNIVESYIGEVCSFKKDLLDKKMKVWEVRSDRIRLMFDLGFWPDLKKFEIFKINEVWKFQIS